MSIQFIESPRFPDEVAYSSSYGPEYFTWTVQLSSGYSSRDSRWIDPLHSFVINKPISRKEDALTFLNLFHICKGAGAGFRIKDHLDFETDSTTGRLGEADVAPGGVTIFQLTKKYIWGSYSYYRYIKKPVIVYIYKNSILLTVGVDYTIDMTTGLVTFSVAPALNDTLHWIGEFDVPAVFSSDKLQTLADTANVWNFGTITITELRLP